MMNPVDSNAIKQLRFPLILLIVANHTNIWTNAMSPDTTGVAATMMKVLGNDFTTIRIPLFFIMAGLLYFREGPTFTRAMYLRKTRNRIYSLLIPYIIWNVVKYITPILKSLISSYTSIGIDITGHEITPLTFSGILDIFGLRFPESYPENMYLWFLLNLIFYTLISPVIYFLIKHLRWIGLILLLIINYATDLTLISGIGWFALGASVSILQLDINRLLVRRNVFTFLTLWVVPYLFMTLFDFRLTVLVFLSNLGGCATLYSAMRNVHFFTENPAGKYLYSATFFLYVFHGIIIGFISQIMSLLIVPDTQLKIILMFCLILAVTLGCTFAVFSAWKAISPRTLSIATGRRC